MCSRAREKKGGREGKATHQIKRAKQELYVPSSVLSGVFKAKEHLYKSKSGTQN